MEELRRPRVRAINMDAYLEGERVRADQRIRQGWSRAYARQNQLLPYGGTFLSPGEEALLDRALNDTADADDASSDDVLGAALLSTIMTTGRSLATIVNATFCDAHDGHSPSLSTAGTWTWWFVPGAPTSSQMFRKSPEPPSAARLSSIALVCASRTLALILKQRRTPEVVSAVFGASLAQANASLRRYVVAAGVQASTRKIEGWLFQRLVLSRGGDTAVAALITGRSALISQTVVHYTALGSEEVAARVADAVGEFDTVPTKSEAPPAHAGRIGSRYSPLLSEVQGLAAVLSDPLAAPGRGRRRDPLKVHNAITTYTIIMTQFATGCRGGRILLPDPENIDPATGYIVIDDKPDGDNFKSRIVWVPHDCRTQLNLYHSHLRKLAGRLPSLGKTIVETTDPFYVTPEKTIVPVTRKSLMAELGKAGWPYPRNAGRHFLRSALVGKVSTETLHATLGHWHVGTEAWGAVSAFDPVAYRLDLAASLVPLMRSSGWQPRSGL